MTSNDYFNAHSAYRAACDAADDCAGSGPIFPDDEIEMQRASRSARDALRAIVATPAISLAEVTARASILASLINEHDGDGVREEFWPALSARIAADLQALATGQATTAPRKAVPRPCREQVPREGEGGWPAHAAALSAALTEINDGGMWQTASLAMFREREQWFSEHSNRQPVAKPEGWSDLDATRDFRFMIVLPPSGKRGPQVLGPFEYPVPRSLDFAGAHLYVEDRLTREGRLRCKKMEFAPGSSEEIIGSADVILTETGLLGVIEGDG